MLLQCSACQVKDIVPVTLPSASTAGWSWRGLGVGLLCGAVVPPQGLGGNTLPHHTLPHLTIQRAAMRTHARKTC